MIEIKNKKFTEERALYNTNDAIISDCVFESSIGESPLKECNNIKLLNSKFSIRYALWHVSNFHINNINMDELSRACLWYSNFGTIDNSYLHGIKVIRECHDIKMNNCDIDSEEFGWKSYNLEINDSKLNNTVYPFLMSHDVKINNMDLSGKYSFQYTKNITIENSNLKTKDAFWHTENTIIKDSYVSSEYIGWYSKNLTLINCTIEGIQPFCYCENLKLVNCKMVNGNLAFEYSSVDADINGEIESIKNPLSGKIVCDGVGEVIMSNQVKPCTGEIIIRKK